MIEPTEVEKQLEAQRLILLKQKKDAAIKSQVALKQAELTALRQEINSQQQNATQAAAAAAVERMNQQKELRKKLNLPSQQIPSSEFREPSPYYKHEVLPDVPDDESFYNDEKEEIEDAVVVNHDIVTWIEEADRKALHDLERRASLEEIKKERDRLLKLDKMMQDRKTARDRLGGPNWLNK
jgi:hypothetical protein